MRPLPSTEPIRVTRGLEGIAFLRGSDGERMSYPYDHTQLLGTVQHEPGYMSTSVGHDLVVTPDGRTFHYRLDLTLPPGTPALWIGPNSGLPRDNELLLARDTRYRITGISRDDAADITTITAQVVLDDTTHTGPTEGKGKAPATTPAPAAGIFHGDGTATRAALTHRPRQAPATGTDCVLTTLTAIRDSMRGNTIRLPEHPASLPGRSRSELEQAAGGELRAYPDQQSVADTLLTQGYGAQALVVTVHTTATADGIGGHAYRMVNDSGTIRVHDAADPGHTAPGQRPHTAVHAILYTPDGQIAHPRLSPVATPRTFPTGIRIGAPENPSPVIDSRTPGHARLLGSRRLRRFATRLRGPAAAAPPVRTEPTNHPRPAAEPSSHPRPAAEPTNHPQPAAEPSSHLQPAAEPSSQPWPAAEPSSHPRQPAEPVWQAAPANGNQLLEVLVPPAGYRTAGELRTALAERMAANLDHYVDLLPSFTPAGRLELGIEERRRARWGLAQNRERLRRSEAHYALFMRGEIGVSDPLPEPADVVAARTRAAEEFEESVRQFDEAIKQRARDRLHHLLGVLRDPALPTDHLMSTDLLPIAAEELALNLVVLRPGAPRDIYSHGSAEAPFTLLYASAEHPGHLHVARTDDGAPLRLAVADLHTPVAFEPPPGHRQQPPPTGTRHADIGTVDAGGVRAFGSDAAGLAYGETVLNRWHLLTPMQQHAVWTYDTNTIFNDLLRGGPDLLARELADGREGARYAALLTELTGREDPPLAELVAHHRAGADAIGPVLGDQRRAGELWQLLDRIGTVPSEYDRVIEMIRQAENYRQMLQPLFRKYYGTEPRIDRLEQGIELLDEATGQPLPNREPIRVVRGLDYIGFLRTHDGEKPSKEFDEMARQFVGTVQREPGYLSTAVGRDLVVTPDTRPFAYRLNLTVPPGAHGLWIGRKSGVHDGNELLLARDTRYRITGATRDEAEDLIILDAEVLLPDTAGTERESAVAPPVAAPDSRSDAESASRAAYATALSTALSGDTRVDFARVLTILTHADAAHAAHRLDDAFLGASGRPMRDVAGEAVRQGRLTAAEERRLARLMGWQPRNELPAGVTPPRTALPPGHSGAAPQVRAYVAAMLEMRDIDHTLAFVEQLDRNPRRLRALQDAYRDATGGRDLAADLRDHLPADRQYLDHIFAEPGSSWEPGGEPVPVEWGTAIAWFEHLAGSRFEHWSGDYPMPFGYLDTGCVQSAHHVALELISLGTEPRKILVNGAELMMNQTLPDGSVTALNWLHHVANLVYTRGRDGKAEWMVWDPAVADEPVPSRDWLRTINLDAERAEWFEGPADRIVDTFAARRAEDDAADRGWLRWTRDGYLREQTVVVTDSHAIALAPGRLLPPGPDGEVRRPGSLPELDRLLAAGDADDRLLRSVHVLARRSLGGEIRAAVLDRAAEGTPPAEDTILDLIESRLRGNPARVGLLADNPALRHLLQHHLPTRFPDFLALNRETDADEEYAARLAAALRGTGPIDVRALLGTLRHATVRRDPAFLDGTYRQLHTTPLAAAVRSARETGRLTDAEASRLARLLTGEPEPAPASAPPVPGSAHRGDTPEARAYAAAVRDEIAAGQPHAALALVARVDREPGTLWSVQAAYRAGSGGRELVADLRAALPGEHDFIDYVFALPPAPRTNPAPVLEDTAMDWIRALDTAPGATDVGSAARADRMATALIRLGTHPRVFVVAAEGMRAPTTPPDPSGRNAPDGRSVPLDRYVGTLVHTVEDGIAAWQVFDPALSRLPLLLDELLAYLGAPGDAEITEYTVAETLAGLQGDLRR
ncbi:hypothetical protein LTT61_23155 [Nocardia asteroides]|nr:hypothetical protein LTT61_23155 [Nocardia asteroides]